MSFSGAFHSEKTSTFQKVCCLALCLIVLTSSGCLRRRMTINSNPQGATVYVDGHQIGKTPVSTDFTYYGTRNIRLEMDNYQTKVVKQKVTPPWYEFPALDFFTETFTPGEVKDHHVWTYDLQQRTISSDEQIMERAKSFAFEGSRSVNSDGTLGAPITSENYHAPRRPMVGDNPDAGNYNMPDSIQLDAPSTELRALPTENTVPQQDYNFMPNPNAFPRGSADWDTPNRYPTGN